MVLFLGPEVEKPTSCAYEIGLECVYTHSLNSLEIPMDLARVYKPDRQALWGSLSRHPLTLEVHSWLTPTSLLVQS